MNNATKWMIGGATALAATGAYAANCRSMESR